MKAWVSDADPNYGINWCTSGFLGCPGVDVIRSNFTRVFSSGVSAKWDGLFVSLHEYGHGYHYYAVEDWASGAGICSNGSHGWEETENLGCAFVEGLADWFSMVTIGPTIDNAPYGGDYGLENNLGFYPGGGPTNPPPGGDGVRVESAVAAFLYDVIDGATELDGVNNGVGMDETFDNLTGLASGVLARIRYCKLNGASLKLSGADQLVYCLEGNPTAYTEAQFLSPAWRSYSSVSFEQSVPALNSAKVRALWEYNMYGIP